MHPWGVISYHQYDVHAGWHELIACMGHWGSELRKQAYVGVFKLKARASGACVIISFCFSSWSFRLEFTDHTLT